MEALSGVQPLLPTGLAEQDEAEPAAFLWGLWT